MQKQLAETFEEISREQLARAKQEMELASEFTAKLAGARSVPDAMNVYQDWASKRMAFLADDGQRLFQQGQKVINSTVKALSNGNGYAGT
jgi:hypothetical protein